MSLSRKSKKRILKNHIVSYEKRLVAFLDLQGFKDDIICNYPAEAIGALFGQFDYLKKSLEKDTESLQITIISDSIVISVTLDKPENLISFFEACSYFAKSRIGKSFTAIKGGISYGELHHKDNIVFGPALVDAYDISEGSHKSDYLRLRMPADVFNVVRALPAFGGLSLAVLFPESEENKYYVFNPWLLHFAIASMDQTVSKLELFDKIIVQLKDYVEWCVMNMAKHRNKSNKIFSKYEDLLIYTIYTFKTIKKIYYSYLTDAAKETVDFYSDEEKAVPFIQQLEQNFKDDDLI